MTARTAVAVLLAVIGMLAIGGAWSSATAAPGSDNGNTNANSGHDGQANNKNDNGNYNNGNGQGNHGKGNSCSNPAHQCETNNEHQSGGGGGDSTPTTAAPNTPTTAGPNTPDQPTAEVLGENQSQGGAVAGELARTGSTAETMGFVALALFAFGGAAILFARREEQYGLVA